MSDPYPFTCPRCGGHHFGNVAAPGPAGGPVRLVRTDCHNTADGEPPGRWERGPDGRMRFAGSRVKACGWSAPYDPAAPWWAEASSGKRNTPVAG